LLLALLLVSAAPGIPSATAKTPLRVVVLGDSYAAGNGAGDYRGPRGCYRSKSNWAARYIETLKSEYSVIDTNRACSGGVINDVRSRRFMETRSMRAIVGSADPESPEARQIAEGFCSSPYRDDEQYEVSNIAGLGFGQIIFDCTRTMDPQWDAVGKSTDVVLLSIGGNDLRFAKIVEFCFAVGQRSPHDCKDKIEYANQHVNDVRDDLFALLRDLKNRMRPGSKIILNSYPYLEKDSSLTLGREVFGIGTVYPVGREVRALGDRGEQAQREAVEWANAAVGVEVVYMNQIKGLFAGHEPDGRVSSRNPDRWLHEFDTFTSSEWYHYNSLGHQAIGALLAGNGTFGVTPAGASGGGAVDIAFLIDTTGSMGSSIDSAKAAATQLISEVQARTSSARFAVIDYRDFPERTGASYDYPAQLDQDFTSAGDLAAAAIQGLSLGFGGDGPETMFSALDMAYGLSWRPGVKKMTIVLADAPPLSPEPISGFTAEDVIQRSLEIDPVEVHAVDVGFATSSDLELITEETNGGVYYGSPSTAAEEIENAIDESLDRPFAWAGGPYVGTVGTEFEFDGTGSYGIESEITKWEWDFDADGTPELVSGEPRVHYTYPGSYEGLVSLKVTDADERVGLGTAIVSVSTDGDGIPEDQDNCPADSNLGQEDWDEDAVGDVCDPSPGFPIADLPGVFEGFPSPPAPERAGSARPSEPPAVADLKIGKPRIGDNHKRLAVPLRCLSLNQACSGKIALGLSTSSKKLRASYAIRAGSEKVLLFRLPVRLREHLATTKRLLVKVEAISLQGVQMRRQANLRL
jgi:von Willebrand factor type A domain/PKD domain